MLSVADRRVSSWTEAFSELHKEHTNMARSNYSDCLVFNHESTITSITINATMSQPLVFSPSLHASALARS